jgi:hypothetical protein
LIPFGTFLDQMSPRVCRDERYTSIRMKITIRKVIKG